MSEYFTESKFSGGRVKVELDLFNYATKADLKNATGVDTSKVAKKVDLASLKSNVDKLDIDKLKKVPNSLSSLKSKVHKLDVDKLFLAPFDLSKLSDVVKNDVIKKVVYNGKKENITNAATKSTLNAKINEAKGKIPSITNLANTTAFNAKVNEVKGKIPNVTNLATTTAFIAVENKIRSFSNLFKKLTITQKLMKLKRKCLVKIMINILLLQNLIS